MELGFELRAPHLQSKCAQTVFALDKSKDNRDESGKATAV
jgi:hypothetical protein